MLEDQGPALRPSPDRPVALAGTTQGSRWQLWQSASTPNPRPRVGMLTVEMQRFEWRAPGLTFVWDHQVLTTSSAHVALAPRSRHAPAGSPWLPSESTGKQRFCAATSSGPSEPTTRPLSHGIEGHGGHAVPERTGVPFAPSRPRVTTTSRGAPVEP